MRSFIVIKLYRITEKKYTISFHILHFIIKMNLTLESFSLFDI